MSNSTLKSYASKVAGGVAGVTMLAMSAMSVGAQSVSIEQLLAQIAQLQAQLTALQGGSTSGSTGVMYSFTRNLQVGSTGEDVRMLQKALNASADTRVASTGAGSPGAETTYFGPATKAAVIKFQNKYASEVLTPSGLSSGTGFVGPSTRAKLNSMSTGGSTNPTTPVTGTMGVTLSSSSPLQGAVIAGQGLADLAHYTFTNTSNTEAVVTKIVINRGGISNDSAFTNIYLYDGGKRVTDSATVSSGVITFNDTSGIIRVPAGSSKTISVRADVSSGATGQVLAVSLASVTSNVTTSGNFPIAGAFFSVATATLATVDFGTATGGGSTAPQNETLLWQSTASVSQQAVNLRAISFRNVGSISTSDINNFKLFVDGTQVATAAGMDANGYVTFDLGSNPRRLETGGRIIKLVGDIVGGSTRTYQFQLRQTGDVMLIDTQLNQPIIPTYQSSTFSAISPNSTTISGGSVSVSKANSSPTSNVTVGASGVKLATFEFRASGERVKVEALKVKGVASDGGGFDNGKILLNGAQIGSTKDLTNDTAIEFTFGSSFFIEPNQTAVVDILADTKKTDGSSHASGSTASTSLVYQASYNNAQGMNSLSVITLPGSADVVGNTITMSSSALTLTKFSGYGNQTIPAGTNNARLGSFVLSAGSAEGVNVNTILITLTSTQEASLTSLWLKDVSTGQMIGTEKSNPDTSNSFSVNLNIPASGTKNIDVMGSILSSAGSGVWGGSGSGYANADAEGTGATTGSSALADAADLQTITIGSGSLALAQNASDPTFNTANIIAGSSNVKAGKFRFTGINSSFTVQELMVKVPTDAATSTDSVVLRYKDANGTTQTTSAQSLAIPTAGNGQTHATATFTGLNVYVPANGDADIEVLANVASIAAGARSGKALTVSIDYNNGFKAVSSSGAVSTSVGSADVSGNGTFYIRKSVPTFTRVLTGINDPVTGQAIYKFTVAADNAGPIEIKKLSFSIATSGGVIITDMSLYDAASPSSAINTSVVNTVGQTGSEVATFYAGASGANDTVISVEGGSSKTFEIRGTVSGWSSDDSINISFSEDSTASITAASGTFSTEKLVWSDRSVVGSAHTTATADWINGYQVRDFTNDVQTYTY